MKAFIPAVIWGLVILVLSVMPGSSLPDFSLFNLFQPDKAGHVIVYAVFVALMLYGFYKNYFPEKVATSKVLYAVLIGICYGIVMELLQYAFFTGRNFDVLDIIANIIGCFVGVTSLKLFSLLLR